MEIHFDLLTIRTAARLAGVKALLRLLQDAMPKFEEQEHSALLKLAREKNLFIGQERKASLRNTGKMRLDSQRSMKAT